MNEVLSQLHARKSVRAFADTPVPPEVKRAVLEAACAAPTAGNQQLYTILDITDQALKDTLADTCDHQPFIARAPMVLIFCADCQKWYDAFAAGGCAPRKPGAGDLWLALSDANIAAQNAVTAAWSLGLGSCYIAGVRGARRHGGVRLPHGPAAGADQARPPCPGAHRPRKCLPAHGCRRTGGHAGWQRRGAALRRLAGRLLQAQVQLGLLQGDEPLHGGVPGTLPALTVLLYAPAAPLARPRHRECGNFLFTNREKTAIIIRHVEKCARSAIG